MTSIHDPAHYLFNDLDPATQADCVSDLVPQPHKAHFCRLTRDSYRYIPSGYVLCEKDQATPRFVQEAMIKKAQDAGVQLMEYRMDSGHFPFISQPRALVDILLAFVEVLNRKD